MTLPAVLCWGRDALVMYNDACAALCRDQDDCVPGCTLAESWPDSDAFREGMNLARQGGASIRRDQEITVRMDGGQKAAWFSLSYSPLHDEDSQVAGALAVFFDTTGRVLAERSLREREGLLSSIFSKAHVGLSLVSLEGDFLRVNDELCRMMGRSREELDSS